MRRNVSARILVAAGVGAVLLAAIVACQPRPIGAGTKIPIAGNSYFVVPQGWTGRPEFGDDRRYDFYIKQDKIDVGQGEFAFRNAALGPGFSALKKAAERKGIRAAEKASSVALGGTTLRLTTFCYLLDPFYDDAYRKHVTPPWAFLGYAEMTSDGKWIAVGVRYDIPTDVVGREAATVPPALIASYEADFYKVVTTSLHFE